MERSERKEMRESRKVGRVILKQARERDRETRQAQRNATAPSTSEVGSTTSLPQTGVESGVVPKVSLSTGSRDAQPQTTKVSIDDLFARIEAGGDKEVTIGDVAAQAPIEKSTTQLSSEVASRPENKVRNLGEYINQKAEPYAKQQRQKAERKAAAIAAIAGLGDLGAGIANLVGTMGGAPNIQLSSVSGGVAKGSEARMARTEALMAARERQQQAQNALQYKLASLAQQQREQAAKEAQQEWERKRTEENDRKEWEYKEKEAQRRKERDEKDAEHQATQTRIAIQKLNKENSGKEDSIMVFNPNTGQLETIRYNKVDNGALIGVLTKLIELQNPAEEVEKDKYWSKKRYNEAKQDAEQAAKYNRAEKFKSLVEAGGTAMLEYIKSYAQQHPELYGEILRAVGQEPTAAAKPAAQVQPAAVPTKQGEAQSPLYYIGKYETK